MANEDARADALRTLGVARRERPPSTPKREAEPADEAEEGAHAEEDAEDEAGGMVPATEEAPAVRAPEGATEEAPPVEAAPAPAAPPAVTGLGIKRRKPAAAAAGADADAKADGPAADAADATAGGGAAAAEAKAAEAAPLTRRLGSDQVAVFMANYFRVRPKMRELLPERTFELKRTHGFYTGDGRPERKIITGFEPALVLYTLPVFPEQVPEFTQPKNKMDWKNFSAEMIDPGLHRQPVFAEDGFIVDTPFNGLGDSYVYLVFRADGKPLVEAAPVEEEEQKPRGSGGGGLGIKRRR